MEPAGKPLSFSNTSSITHLIKLFGHANTNTFFKVYVHSFDVVASHAMERVFEEEDSLQLNGNTISKLVPNCASRTTQAKLRNRSVKYLVELMINKGLQPSR